MLLFYVAMLLHKHDLRIWLAPPIPIKDCTTWICMQSSCMFLNLKTELKKIVSIDDQSETG